MTIPLRFAILPLLAAALPACAQSGAAEGAWFSYRDTYRAMIRFEKYGQPKQFLEHRLQAVTQEKGATLDGVRLTLEGKTTRLELPLDALGRTVFPLLKSAYDENAELRVNRPAGSITLVPRITIAPRADGIYDAADLRAACAQVLDYLHSIADSGAAGKHCVAVAFSYPKGSSGSSAVFRPNAQSASPLPAAEGSPFPGSTGSYRVLTYRFADWPDKGQVVTDTMPLAVAALYE
jgi:hypothetical protein